MYKLMPLICFKIIICVCVAIVKGSLFFKYECVWGECVCVCVFERLKFFQVGISIEMNIYLPLDHSVESKKYVNRKRIVWIWNYFYSLCLKWVRSIPRTTRQRKAYVLIFLNRNDKICTILTITMGFVFMFCSHYFQQYAAHSKIKLLFTSWTMMAMPI